MPPTFYMNNFKPWARSYRKPSPPKKPPNPCTARIPKSPCPKSYHASLPSTLPLTKHHLPARPPAKVCMHISANTRLSTPSSSQSQTLEISVPEQNTCLETPEHRMVSPHDSAPHFPDLDSIPCCDIQDNTDIPIEPPTFWGDSADNGPSSPSISSSDDSLEEFFRLPHAQEDIPINPEILANYWPWEDGNLQQSVPQADSFINSETTCSYPDPPPVLHRPPNYYRGSCENVGGQNGNIQTSDHSCIHDHQQLRPSQSNTDLDASYPDGVCGAHHIGGQLISSKRKTQQSDGRVHKWLRVPSISPSRGGSTALRSHFISAPLDDCLQFLSWLFKGALSHCMSSSTPTACEKREVLETSCSSTPHETEQNRRDRRKARGGLRKNMPWSTEEASLLLKLRKGENQSWSEVARFAGTHRKHVFFSRQSISRGLPAPSNHHGGHGASWG